MEEYEVEKIIDVKRTQNGLEYLIKWKEFPENENSWEPEGNLNCQELLDEFWENRKQTRFTVRGTRFINGSLEYFAFDQRYGLFTIKNSNKQNYYKEISDFWEKSFLENKKED